MKQSLFNMEILFFCFLVVVFRVLPGPLEGGGSCHVVPRGAKSA